MKRKCTNCETECPYGDNPYSYRGRVWWNLSDYNGITGYFCPDCFDMVEHWDGVPKNLAGYIEILEKQHGLDFLDKKVWRAMLRV